MKIAAIGNANFIIGGNETYEGCNNIDTILCETKGNCEGTFLESCTCDVSTPGTTTPTANIKTRKDCPIGFEGNG
ncbi:MAG: hypothetical protein AAF611_01960 [Bacteroidota bacterium]